MQHQSSLELLMRTRVRLSDPKHWASHYGQLVDGSGRQCLVTSLRKDVPCIERVVDNAAYFAICRATKSPSLAYFNDSHGHAEVLDALDRAIEAEWEKTPTAEREESREAVAA